MHAVRLSFGAEAAKGENVNEEESVMKNRNNTSLSALQ